ncbi:uncharacterized protein METZ01_LOCUS192314 [marine metagenome]|uniref:Uncharacterized protein n=1 Tax=marine metagenome TaxID=408172 RepID=A0A382DLX1_9ZZZZ
MTTEYIYRVAVHPLGASFDFGLEGLCLMVSVLLAEC